MMFGVLIIRVKEILIILFQGILQFLTVEITVMIRCLKNQFFNPVLLMLQLVSTVFSHLTIFSVVVVVRLENWKSTMVLHGFCWLPILILLLTLKGFCMIYLPLQGVFPMPNLDLPGKVIPLQTIGLLITSEFILH